MQTLDKDERTFHVKIRFKFEYRTIYDVRKYPAQGEEYNKCNMKNCLAMKALGTFPSLLVRIHHVFS